MPKPIKPEFGAAVRAALEERKLSRRGQRALTSLDHVTVGTMAQGIVPTMETVVRFAQGLGLDVNQWLTLAGYEPMPPALITGTDLLWDLLLDLQKEFPDRRIPLPVLRGEWETLTRDSAEIIIRSIRNELLERENPGD